MNNLSEVEITKLNAPLYIDIYCWNCKKLCALSNTVECDGRRYCEKCNPQPSLEVLFKIFNKNE